MEKPFIKITPTSLKEEMIKVNKEAENVKKAILSTSFFILLNKVLNNRNS